MDRLSEALELLKALRKLFPETYTYTSRRDYASEPLSGIELAELDDKLRDLGVQ